MLGLGLRAKINDFLSLYQISSIDYYLLLLAKHYLATLPPPPDQVSSLYSRGNLSYGVYYLSRLQTCSCLTLCFGQLMNILLIFFQVSINSFCHLTGTSETRRRCTCQKTVDSAVGNTNSIFLNEQFYSCLTTKHFVKLPFLYGDFLA